MSGGSGDTNSAHFAGQRMGERELAGVQRLPPEAQGDPLRPGDQLVERPGGRGGAAALRQPEEDLLRRSVELVADQREPRGLEVGADTGAGGRCAARSAAGSRPGSAPTTSQEVSEGAPCGGPASSPSPARRRARAAGPPRTGPPPALPPPAPDRPSPPPRGECRLEPARVHRPAAAGDEAAGLAVQPVGRVGLLARRIAVTLLERPGERAHVVARRGMDGEARRLLHHQERLVLVDDGERRRLAGVSRDSACAGRSVAQGQMRVSGRSSGSACTRLRPRKSRSSRSAQEADT